MPVPTKMLTLISHLAFLIFAVSATEVYSQVDATGVIPTTESCGTPAVGCEVCGARYEGCGASACFNPSAGEICCNSIFVCPASHTCGDAEGTCNPPTVTTTLKTTLRTTSTMTTTATIALAPVNGPNYPPGPAQTPPPASNPAPDVNSTFPESSSAPPLVTPTPAPTEPEPLPTNPPANGSQPAIIETPSVSANTTSTSSAVIDAGTSSGESVTTSTSFFTPSTSYTTRTESQASDSAGASANPTSGASSEGLMATWWGSVAVASMLGAWIVQCLT